MTRTDELIFSFNDAVVIAAQMAHDLKKNGQISERFEAQIIAQLNGTLYTMAFALPPGMMPIQMEDTKDQRHVTKVETPKRKG